MYYHSSSLFTYYIYSPFYSFYYIFIVIRMSIHFYLIYNVFPVSLFHELNTEFTSELGTSAIRIADIGFVFS